MRHDRDRITVLLLAEQKKALEALAKREGEPLAVVVRRILRDELARQGQNEGRDDGR